MISPKAFTAIIEWLSVTSTHCPDLSLTLNKRLKLGCLNVAVMSFNSVFPVS